MDSKRFKLFALGAVASVALVGLACGDDDDDATTPTSSPTMAEMSPTEMASETAEPTEAGDMPSVETGAAALNAGLTALLQEHVYLGLSATNAALTGGDFEGAAAALDQNSVELAAAIGSVYGDEAGDAFLELWRIHIGHFVEYTQAVAAGDDAAAQASRDELDAYRADFGAFIESANPNLPADVVADALTPHTETFFAAIDAQAAGDADAFSDMKAAADEMPAIAQALAGGIVAQDPETFDGAVDDGASGLRTGLTKLLQEHVYLGLSATNAALTGGDFEGAAAALDQNSVELAAAIGSVYGDEAGDAFLELWRIHIGHFVEYTQAVAAGDDAAAQASRDELDAYRADFGAFIESANPNLPADVVADALTPHTETFFAAIDAQAAGDADAFSDMKAAADEMPAIALALAGGIVTQFPDMFGS